MQGRADTRTPEVESAWRFSALNWALGGAMVAALAVSLALTDFSLALPGLAVAAGYIAVYGGFAHANARSPRRRDPQVMFILAPMAQIVLFAAAMTPLTYVAAAINVPIRTRTCWRSIARSGSTSRRSRATSTTGRSPRSGSASATT